LIMLGAGACLPFAGVLVTELTLSLRAKVSSDDVGDGLRGP
jgi:hypothetical protein